MARFETWLKSDLKNMVSVTKLTGNLFSADNGGNLIGVEVLDGGSPVVLEGIVTGYAIRSDGATLIVTGELDGNKAWIELPQSAYVHVGPISIVIKNSGTTIGACSGYVYRSTTDTIVDPGHIIPSLDELLEKIADCEAATTAANEAAELANTKAGLANDAAALANQKAELADTKAGLANDAATLANQKAELADTKAGLANDAAALANEKAGLADTKAGLANDAADLANTKAELADSKATAANNAANAANTAAGKINNMTVAANGLSSGSDPTATISEVSGHKHILFGIPKGDKGDTGRDFHIKRTFSSIAEMESYDPDDDHTIYKVLENDFVMIDTGSVQDPDTGKLYCYEPQTVDVWRYIGDLSGSQGIQGPVGATGATGAQTYVHIKYSANEPTSDSDMHDTADEWMGVYSGLSATAPTTYASYVWYKIKGPIGATGPTGATGDPTSLIDDTAGDGDTGKTWSADKLVDEFGVKADKSYTVLNNYLARGVKSGTSVGQGSIAFGNNVEASYDYAYAFGNGTKASNAGAFAEGSTTKATGQAAHAEGQGANASGNYSHAQNNQTVANHKSQSASGEFNVADDSAAESYERGNYAEIVGNGTGTNARSNARTLDWNGNERIMGDIYVGCGADSSGGTALGTAVGTKADKVTGATGGNFAGLDANGNLTDSGHKHSDYLTSHQDISGKADKAPDPTAGNVATLDANGNPVDSGKTLEKSVPSNAVFTDTNTIAAGYVTDTTITWDSQSVRNIVLTVAFTDYKLRTNNTFMLVIKDAISVSPASGVTTKVKMNVNSTGEKSTDMVYTALISAGVYHVYYDGTIYNIRSDGLSAPKINGHAIGTAVAKNVDTSISEGSTSTNLPTSKAVEQRISGFAAKAVSPTAGNVATLDASGNPTDSGKTLGASVPADAVFTDTTYDPATQSTAGLMSAADKAKLDGLDVIETVTGTTPSITGVANHRYICGEVSTLSITPPVSGIIDVIFTSGSTATVLTLPNTVKMPDWFEVEADMTYEINIMDGVYGSVMAWA